METTKGRPTRHRRMLRRALRGCVRALVRLLRILVLLSVFIALLAGGGWIWLSATILSDLPEDLSYFRTYRPPTSCRIYDDQGALVDEFYLERRVWVPLQELGQVVPRAFVASEDSRFYEHPGVDPAGIARAFAANLQSGGQSQGGSTITQQLVKNLMVGTERSYRRKLREAVLAIRLERELSKDEILELYLNYVFLGSGNYGVEAAAQDYFGVSARDLDPGQAALLAGLVPAPARYSPRKHPDRARERRLLVLGRMVEEGIIDPGELDEHQDDPVVAPRVPAERELVNGAYITQVRRELRGVFGQEVPYEVGLHVHTALNQPIQRTAVEAVREALVALDAREGRRGAIATLPPERWESFLARGDGLARDVVTNTLQEPTVGSCFSALVVETGPPPALRAGPWALTLAPDQCSIMARESHDGRAAGPLCRQLRAGDVLRACLAEPGIAHLDDRPWGEGGAVVLENATGRVLALVGGYSSGLEGFVRATQARRQPGSSFKPYVYATALLGGHRQIDRVRDAPLSLPGAGGKVWSPKNYGGGYAGELPMRRAFAQSLNTVAVRLTLEAGPDAVVQLAHAMGVQTPLRADPTIALGSSEITPMDQALGYATIARMGVPTEAAYVDRLLDLDGQEVGARGEVLDIPGFEDRRLPGRALPRVLPAGIAYELADMMREVVRAGTARRAWRPEFDRAGKTGTTNDCVDAWFVGFTPRYTVAVWVGSDGTASLGEKETGGKAALPAWIRIVEALPQPAGERFPIPDEAILVEHEGAWIGLPRGAVPEQALPLGPIEPELPLPAP